MVFRHYGENDYEAVCDFLIALNREDGSHINWNWARFEWMAGHPDFDRGAEGAIGLWRDGKRVVGAAIYDMYFGEAFCGALPGYEELFPEILAYAWRELRDENGLGVALCDGNAREIAAARAMGFVPTEQGETVMERRLEGPFRTGLPAGFSFSEIDPGKEGIRELQWLFWQGFDHGDDRAAFEEDYRKTMQAGLRPRPHFDPRLSIAAAAPDGELAAYCCLWYDARTDYAYVEPVCTAPACRGRGIGRAVVSGALRRAAALGAKRACVISDLPFYERLGFEKPRHWTFYWKK